MQNVIRDLESIINNEARAFALYTVENRAIPQIMDGMKPVQRFMVYRAIHLGRGDQKKMHKLASVAGGVADAGYHHGEGNAQEAGALMANTWNNNFPLLDGEGNFGSRLVQQAAASRYIFCRLSQNFRKVFKDEEVAPIHPDEEHLPPRFYLPVIPTVLLNGVEGIATGYATSILPHSLESVIECTKLALEGTLDKEPKVQFPKFTGDITTNEQGQYEICGTYEFSSKLQMYISEIPPKFDRAKYIENVLDPLEAANKITYEDDCSKAGFGFKIKFRKEFGLYEDDRQHAQIMKEFKLIERITPNHVVIDENGNLNDSLRLASDIIKHFVSVRLTYVDKRIAYMQEKMEHTFKLALAKALFIKEVNAETLIVKGKKRADLKAELSANERFVGFEDELLSMNIYHMTDDEVESLKEKAKSAKAEYDYWKTTDAKTEYRKDLEAL